MTYPDQLRLQAAHQITQLLELRLCDDHVIGDAQPALLVVDAIAEYTVALLVKERLIDPRAPEDSR